MLSRQADAQTNATPRTTSSSYCIYGSCHAYLHATLAISTLLPFHLRPPPCHYTRTAGLRMAVLGIYRRLWPLSIVWLSAISCAALVLLLVSSWRATAQPHAQPTHYNLICLTASAGDSCATHKPIRQPSP